MIELISMWWYLLCMLKYNQCLHKNNLLIKFIIKLFLSNNINYGILKYWRTGILHWKETQVVCVVNMNTSSFHFQKITLSVQKLTWMYLKMKLLSLNYHYYDNLSSLIVSLTAKQWIYLLTSPPIEIFYPFF